MIPNGSAFRCSTCHFNPNGGGSRTSFGQDVFSIVGGPSNQAFWDATLAALDSDGDGFSNGVELGDPDGDGIVDPGAEVTHPGDPDSKPQIIEPPLEDINMTIEKGDDDAAIMLRWQGGSGLAQVEAKNSLADSIWRGVSVSSDGEMAVENTAPVRLYQVRDVGALVATEFTAHLSGAAVLPDGLETGASGSGQLTIENDTLTFSVDYQGLSGPATAAHIHGPANTQENAGVLVNLEPFNGGAFSSAGTLAGSVELSGEQKAALLMGHAYVNIHTAANPGGEIRGQIAPVFMASSMNGGSARPAAIRGSGRGSGALILRGNELDIQLEYGALSGAATAAHIHGPASVDETGGVLVNLEPFNGGAFGQSGLVRGTVTLSQDVLSAIIDGQAYVNVHTAANPSGEIRGQVVPQIGMTPMTSQLSGGNVVPTPVDSAGEGLGHFSLTGHQFQLALRYQGLSGPATAAHIHGAADAENNAGVLINLEPYNGGGYEQAGLIAGTVTLTDEQRDAVADGLTYVNIHTAANPGGEIRGQIVIPR